MGEGTLAEISVIVEGLSEIHIIRVDLKLQVEGVVECVAEVVGVRLGDIRLGETVIPKEAPFVDYFEPDAVYNVIPLGTIPQGTLLASVQDSVSSLGVSLENAELLLTDCDGSLDMEAFNSKVVGVVPTLVLVETSEAIVIGGFANVTWPGARGEVDMKAADPSGESFLFLLDPEPVRFAVTTRECAIDRNDRRFRFGPNGCLTLYEDGRLYTYSAWAGYAVEPRWTSLPGSNGDHLKRLEIWRVRRASLAFCEF
jgi:hypothetical protein